MKIKGLLVLAAAASTAASAMLGTPIPSLDAMPPEACFAPGTPHDVLRMHARRRQARISSLQSQPGFQFSDGSRWTTTATNGGGLTQGQVTTITWRIVPDGTPIAGFNGEPAVNSNLRAFLDGIYGSEAVWILHFQSTFNRWSELTGVNYVMEAADDSADLGSVNPGVLGVRADVRIGGHFIDGNSGVLAYNFFPNTGDMVIDTADNFYSNNLANNSLALRNVLAHEHGHGLGFSHSCPVEQTKLMEPFISVAFEHAQLDDKLAGWRGYGDDKENNETSGTASDLGAISSGTTTLGDVSADDDADVDFYKFTVPAGKRAAVTLTPIGTTYLAGPQVSGSCTAGAPFNALAVNDIGVELRSTDGTTILASSNTGGPGVPELIGGTALPGAGTFFVRVFAGAVNNVQGYQLAVTITDNSGSFIGIDDVSLAEGNAGTTNAVFTLTRSGTTTGTSSVTAQTANSTAVAPGDYTATGPTMVTFNPGDTTKTFSVPVVGDAVNEASETFLVNLTSPVNATIEDLQGVGTITNDDAQPSLSINDVSIAEGNSGAANAQFTVTLSAASGQTVTVNHATADGTATGSLLQSNPAAITISTGAAGSASPFPSSITVAGASGTVTKATVTLNGLSHTFGRDMDLLLVGPGGQKIVLMSDAGGTSDVTNATVVFDDAAASNLTSAPIVSGTFKPTNIADGEGPDTWLSPAPAGPYGSALSEFIGTAPNGVWSLFVSDDFAGDGGSLAGGWTLVLATTTADYTAVAGTLTFAPGDLTKTINVPVLGDVDTEPNETFVVNLTGATNATISDNQGTGTITNDDGAVLPTLSINDVSLAEGNAGTTNAVFTVTLSAASASTVTVSGQTANNTAISSGDYTATGPTVLTFNPGDLTETFSVPVVGDALDEANETFFVNLSSPSNATIADGQGTGTITDDDGAPTVSINDVTVTEGNSGTIDAVFTATLSTASGQTVTVSAQTSNVTATAGSDYTATGPTVLSFAPGDLTKTFTVPVTGDVAVEGHETFQVTLSSPANATIADGTGIGEILDNDLAARAFVSEGGSDANDCTIQATPCRTISSAIGRVFVDGEVIVLTPGEYETAPLTITHGVKITSPSGTVAFIRQPITINAPGYRVALRGLTLKGNGTGNGVTITAADSVSIEETTIDAWVSGVSLNNASPVRVFVLNSALRNTVSGLEDAGAVGSSAISISDSRFERNDFGLAIEAARLQVRDSTFVGNSASAIIVGETGVVDVHRSEFTLNGAAVTTVSGGMARVGRSHVFGNDTGFLAVGGTFQTYGTNVLRRNGVDTAGTITTIPEQ